jgi:hypothetical protein
LKNRDDLFGKRRSTGEDGGSGGGGGKSEHVRIRSPSANNNSRGEHVRIRMPSPELSTSSDSGGGAASPSMQSHYHFGGSSGGGRSRRSRNNSCREGDLSDDPEIPSILKQRRRASADDLGWVETGGSRVQSPERASILKRKSSFGSNYSGSHSNYSGRNSPEGTTEATRQVVLSHPIFPALFISSVLRFWIRNLL